MMGERISGRLPFMYLSQFFSQFFTPSFVNAGFWNQGVPFGYTGQNTQNFRGISLAA